MLLRHSGASQYGQYPRAEAGIKEYRNSRDSQFLGGFDKGLRDITVVPIGPYWGQLQPGHHAGVRWSSLRIHRHLRDVQLAGETDDARQDLHVFDRQGGGRCEGDQGHGVQQSGILRSLEHAGRCQGAGSALYTGDGEATGAESN